MGFGVRGVGALRLVVCAAITLVGCDEETPPPPADPWDGVGRSPAVVEETPDGRTSSVELDLAVDGDAAAAVLALIEEHAEDFGYDPSHQTLVQRSRRQVASGEGEMISFDVREGVVPIFGAEIRGIVVRGAIRFVFSSAPRPVAVETTPSMDAAAALAAVRSELRTADAVEPADLDLVVYDRALMLDATHDGTGGDPILAYRFEAAAAGEAGWTEWVVSATDGAVLLRNDGARHARRRLIINARQAGDGTTLPEASASVVWFEEAGAVEGAEVLPGEMAVYGEAQALYTTLDDVHRYWLELLGHDGYDMNGGRLRAFVNFAELASAPEPNAAWFAREATPAGVMPALSARDNEASGALVFTPGMATRDITMHEYTHALIDFVAEVPPMYQAQYGAVDESLADTFAAFFDAAGTSRWIIGQGSASGVLRDLQFPHGDRDESPATWHPACYAQRYGGMETSPFCGDVSCPTNSRCWLGECRVWEGQRDDHGGTHWNSTIPSRAAQLAADGSDLSGYADGCGEALEAIPVRPVGVERLALIYGESLPLLLKYTTFRNLAANVRAMCRILSDLPTPMPITDEHCTSVRNAFARVGLGFADTDYDGVLDHRDNCYLVPNPDQEPVEPCEAPPVERSDLVIEVRDGDDAPISGADVTATPAGVSAGASFSARSDAAGAARLTGLEPGTYAIRAEATGFLPVESEAYNGAHADSRGSVRMAEAFPIAGHLVAGANLLNLDTGEVTDLRGDRGALELIGVTGEGVIYLKGTQQSDPIYRGVPGEELEALESPLTACGVTAWDVRGGVASTGALLIRGWVSTLR